MSQLGKSNLNLNLNLNLGALGSAAGGGARGARFNTQEFRKLADRSEFPFLPGASGPLVLPDGSRVAFRKFWDGELQSYVYLNEFVRTKHDKDDWLAGLVTMLEPTEQKLQDTISQELVSVVDAAPDRESRFAEILFQDGGEGALSYWFGMLMLDPASAPATCLLMRVARRVGEMAVMCLKDHFRFPRPSQLCAAIMPMIDPPVTPSFPAGHALQSYLISHCLKEVRDRPQDHVLLDALAERVAENRIIAGIHYPLDNEGGKLAAQACFQRLKGLPLFRDLVAQAKNEGPTVVETGVPA